MTTVEIKKQDREINFQVDRAVTSDDAQKKIYIAELIRNALNQYLDYDSLYADNTYSLYKLPIVNEATDFIDFEINSLSVHVVPTINRGKNRNVYIPKSYQIFNCKPDIIVFVNFNSALTKMSIDGFIKDVNLGNLSYSKTSLMPADDLILVLKTLQPKANTDNENTINVANELMLAYIDSSLSEEGEQFFLKHLVSNKTIRKNYKLFYGLNCKLVYVAKQHTALTDDNFVAVDSLPVEEELEPIQGESIQAYSLEPNAHQEDVIDDLKSVIEDFDGTFGGEQEETPIDVDDLLLASDEPIELSDGLGEQDIANQETNIQDEPITFDEEPADSQEETFEQEEIAQADDLSSGEELTELDFSGFDEEESLSLNSDSSELSLQEESIAGDDALVEPDGLGEQLPEFEEAQQPPVEDNTEERPALQEEQVSLREEPVALQEESEISAQDSGEELSAEGDGESGDDLFSFLSEMADEVQDENVQPAPAEEPVAEQPQVQEPEPPQQEEFTQEDVQQQVDDYSEQTQNMLNENSFNDAFSPQTADAQVQQETELENTPQATPGVSPVNSKLVAALALILIAGGAYGVYMNKDKIPFLNNSSEIQDLAEEDSKTATEDLPAPIADLSGINTEIPNKAGNQEAPTAPEAVAPAPNAEAVAPAPSAPAAEKTAPTEAKDAQSLPSLPTAVEPPKPKHLNDAIATALTKDFSGVRISKVSWEVSETLLSNPDVKTYLTIAGKSIKNALAQDLMAATEPSFKDTVSVNVTYRKDGGVSQVKIISSSGSTQIDELIVKSIKNTLNYIKMPPLNLDKPEYTAKLVVRL
ncbi:MAG: TonB C-terminal domain-containing protein [bacterium]|nr:TonB C-terminal domain-containing protein [bacterium]